MSSIRMCDQCGAIFSEAEVGWQTGTVSTVGEDEFGQTVTRRVQQDRCADCAVGVNSSTGETPQETADREAAAAAMGQIVQENKAQ